MQEILDNLEKKIPTIKEHGKELGYDNIRVFKSPLAVDKAKLFFLVSIDKTYLKKITLENIGSFQEQLKQLLDSNNIIAIQDDELFEQFKDDILTSAIPLLLENIPKIKQEFGIQDIAPKLKLP